MNEDNYIDGTYGSYSFQGPTYGYQGWFSPQSVPQWSAYYQPITPYTGSYIGQIQPSTDLNTTITENTNSGSGGGENPKGINWKAGLAAAANIGDMIGRSEKNPHGLYDIADPLHHLAGGRTSTAGNVLGGAGVGLFKAGASTGNPYLMAAGGAAKAIGSFINAGWGTKWNKENIDAIKNQNSSLLGFRPDTSSNVNFISSLQGHGPLGTVSKSAVGKDGWFSHKARDKARKLNSIRQGANALYYNKVKTGLNTVDRKNDAMALRNTKLELGGSLWGPSPALDMMDKNAYYDVINNRSNALSKQPLVPVNRFDVGGMYITPPSPNSASFYSPEETMRQYMSYRSMLDELGFSEPSQKKAEEEAPAYTPPAGLLNNPYAIADNSTVPQVPVVPQAAPVVPAASVPAAAPAAAPVAEALAAAASEPIVPGPKDNATTKRLRAALASRGVTNTVHQDAIIANIMVESQGNIGAKNSKSSARGLLQWLGGRGPKKWDFDSQMDYIVDTYNSYDSQNWFNKKAHKRFNETKDPREAARLFRRHYERPEPETYNFTDKYIDMLYGNGKAFGGELGTNGTDFTNGLLEVNAGGSHTMNPYGGVPMGFDPQGVPNLVEEGETVWRDNLYSEGGYVFSNKLTVPKEELKSLGLSNASDDLSYSKASKLIASESKERPNDPISQNGLQYYLNKLRESQEQVRFKKQVEEAAAEQALQSMLSAEAPMATQPVPQEGMAPYMAPEETYGAPYAEAPMSSYDMNLSPSYACGGSLSHKYSLGGNIPANVFLPGGVIEGPYEPFKYGKDFKYLNNGVYDPEYENFIRNTLTQEMLDTYFKSNPEGFSRFLASNPGKLNGVTLEEARRFGLDKKPGDFHNMMGSLYDSWKAYDNLQKDKNYSNIFTTIPTYLSSIYSSIPKTLGLSAAASSSSSASSASTSAESTSAKAAAQGSAQGSVEASGGTGTGTDGNNGTGVTTRNYKPYPTWMRTFPIWASGALSITDALGLTNNADYTYANKLEAAANRAGKSPVVDYTPTGVYTPYMPIDYNNELNLLSANQNATARDAQNVAGTRGAALSAILAANAAGHAARGEALRNNYKYDATQKQSAILANNKVDEINAAKSLEAAIARAKYEETARQFGLTGLSEAAKYRWLADQEASKGRSANLTNTIQGIGNWGRENFIWNQINTDPNRRYGINRNGTFTYYQV